MTWSLKRQIIYIVILVIFISFLGFLVVFPILHKAPTCSDGTQNGDETGIDCGGSCPNACSSQVESMSVLWARSFEVVPGRYNAVAYVVNHNKNVAIREISYRFRFADANNVYIGKREGTTPIPPGGNFAIFAPAVDLGNSIPVYTTFEFTSAPNWLQVSNEKVNQLKVFVSNIQLSGTDTAPRLSATIKNNSLFTIPEVSVVALLYDAAGNAVSASQTYLDKLAPLEGSNLNFTWPSPFATAIVAKEVIPLYDIFSAKLQ